MKRNMYTPRTPRMAKILSFVLIFVLAISITSVEALAATYETEIELKTTSIVLVDRSGSTKDRSEVDAILASMQISEDVPVGYFDSHKVTLDNKYNIGGNSSICEAIDDAVKNDYTHITIITDGQQWPQDYSALGIYSNVDIRFMLTDTEPEAAEKLLAELQNHLANSTLSVVHLDGSVEVLMDGYKPEKYSVQITIPDSVILEPDDTVPDLGDPVDGIATPPAPVIEQTVVECNHECSECTHRCPWWLFLLLALLIAALFDFIHELITRRRAWFGPVVDRINKGDKMIIDVSGSFSGELERAIAEVEKAVGGDAEVIAFAEQAVECKLSEIRTVAVNRGKTDMVSAAELASKLGCKGTVWFTDGQFNGRSVKEAQIAEKFKRTTVVLPQGYDRAGVSDLRKISKIVRIKSL